LVRHRIGDAPICFYKEGVVIMLGWAIAFFVLALIAAVLGFGGIAGASAGIAKILFFVFLVLLVLSFVARAVRGRNVT
jgi:uncharacterized membrane protein YtjA (UPF0391 family)